jgi:hypothetical protein
MSEDNSENLYYYSNKGRQYTFNLDDLTTEELKKFEKMTERQRLKFITNFELERETPFQDSISLKSTMVEARNEKYGDYALLKAKLDELDRIQKMDEASFSDPEKMSLLDKKGNISNAYLKQMNYITEADIRNCMKAFDMKDVSLEMLKKYFNRKVESLNMTGIKTSFLEALKKFYKNLIDETQRDKHLIKKYEDYNKELEDDTDELTENKTKKIMADMQKDLSNLVNIEVKKAKISDKKIYKYLDEKEWESIRDFAEKYKLPKIVDFVSQFLEAEATAVDLMNPDLVTPEEPEKVETSDSKETELTTKEEEPKEFTEKEDLPTELSESITKEETEPESESLDYVGNSESETDINTPMKERLAEVRAEEKAEEDIIVDNFVGMRKTLKNFRDKHFDPKNPKHYERTDPKNPNKKILIGTNGVARFLIGEDRRGYGHEMLYNPYNKTYTYTYTDDRKEPKYKITYIEGDENAEFKPRRKKPYNIKVTVFGEGYKIKYTSGSIVDKIKDKLFKSVNSEIKGLKDEDRNIYKKLESLEKTINELKESIQKKSEIPSPPKLPAPEPVPIEKNKPSNFLDEIKNPHKPLKPVAPTPKPKVQEEYSDIKKILDDRRKDIEYSEDEDSEEEWGEGVRINPKGRNRVSDSKPKGRRMEILEFLKSLD